jgi:hypothetical protein
MITDWRKIPCPICKRRGLHYSDHPHAHGYKDYGVVVCRFCHKRFKAQLLSELLCKEVSA